MVASRGGAAENPDWYTNLIENPTEVLVQDGPAPFRVTVREVKGDEYNVWWERSAAVFPQYNEYKTKTSRIIPILIAEPQ